MPKFILQDDNEPEFRALDDFTRGYIEALFWTENAPGVTTEQWQATEDHAEGSIPDEVGFMDIAPDALATIVAECKRFQEAHKGLLETAYESARGPMAYDGERAGHDFWLTRNHHGAGFWDRKELDFHTDGPNIGDALTEAAHAFSKVNVYLGDDGKVHI